MNNRLLNASKQYKKVILQNVRQQLENKQNHTDIRSQDIQGFWKRVNETPSDSKLPSLPTLHQYFRGVNSSDDTTPEPDFVIDFNTDTQSNSVVNSPILAYEVIAVVKYL